MSSMPLESWHVLRVARERILQRIGWPGIVGLVLVASSIVAGLGAWQEDAAFEKARQASATRVGPRAAPGRAAVAQPPVVADLPDASDIPLLLEQMEQAAIGNGLEWRAAEYRIISATPAQPASLEVRCALNGTYPKLRGMLVQLMTSLPAFSIRGLDVVRPSADVAEVEAKLVLAVFLRDSASNRVVPVKDGS